MPLADAPPQPPLKLAAAAHAIVRTERSFGLKPRIKPKRDCKRVRRQKVRCRAHYVRSPVTIVVPGTDKTTTKKQTFWWKFVVKRRANGKLAITYKT